MASAALSLLGSEWSNFVHRRPTGLWARRWIMPLRCRLPCDYSVMPMAAVVTTPVPAVVTAIVAAETESQ